MSRGASAMSPSLRQQIMNNADGICAIDDAAAEDGTFAGDDIGALSSILRSLETTQAITRVGQRRKTRNIVVNVYRVDDRALQAAERIVENREALCPCGHSGFSNQGERIVCNFRWCPNTYAPEDLEVDDGE